MDYELIKKLYGIEQFQGCLVEDLDYMIKKFDEIPAQVIEIYNTIGGTQQLNRVQDQWLFPDQYRKYNWMDDDVYKDYFILMNENQGVYQIVIKREDMTMDNPPVYVLDGSTIVGKCADSVTEFFMSMLIYQSVFAMEYSPQDFFWYSEEDMQVIRTKLTKLPYKLFNWYSELIEFYTNAQDNMLYIMSDDNQGTYGAMTESSYDIIEAVLGELGEGQ